jgi:hypothetical protein
MHQPSTHSMGIELLKIFFLSHLFALRSFRKGLCDMNIEFPDKHDRWSIILCQWMTGFEWWGGKRNARSAIKNPPVLLSDILDTENINQSNFSSVKYYSVGMKRKFFSIKARPLLSWLSLLRQSETILVFQHPMVDSAHGKQNV